MIENLKEQEIYKADGMTKSFMSLKSATILRLFLNKELYRKNVNGILHI